MGLLQVVRGVGADHVIDDASGFCDCGALETHVCHAVYELGGCDVFVSAVVVVEFGPIDHRDTFRNWCGRFEDCIVGYTWCWFIHHRIADCSCHDNIFWWKMGMLLSTGDYARLSMNLKDPWANANKTGRLKSDYVARINGVLATDIN